MIDPYARGSQAAAAGLWLESCPYPPRSRSREDWEAGWRDQAQRLDDSPFSVPGKCQFTSAWK
jgi:ribosome modulation factor